MDREAVRRSFRRAVCRHLCPSCGATFTDGAVAWGSAWREGYEDALREEGLRLRDGPFKIACEGCGERAWYHVLSDRVEGA